MRKSILPLILVILLSAISQSMVYAADKYGSISCINLLSVSKKARLIQASELAKLITVDEEAQKIIFNPEVAQFIYLNYFSDSVDGGELKIALQDLVDTKITPRPDFYELINQKLLNRLNNPVVVEKIRNSFRENDRGLRPGRLRTKFASVTNSFRQLKGFFNTLSRLKNEIDVGFSQEVMDRGLFDFYGATQLGLKESQLRQWDNIAGGFFAVRPQQIVNMSPLEWAKIAYFASETEAPIHDYSTNSGDAFRAFLPSVSTFMGKNEEQYLSYMQRQKTLSEDQSAFNDLGPFCTNVWCKEENRHELAVKNIGDHVQIIPNKTRATYTADPLGDFSNSEYAIKHLVGRNSSEWNANSVYMFLRAHSNGAANQWIDNIRKDETKHMAIFSAAFKYIFGNQLNLRTQGMLEKIKALRVEAQNTNTNGSVLKGQNITLFEILITHLMIEKKIRDFIKSVPFKTMRKFFDTPVKTIAEPESLQISQEKQNVISKMIIRERKSRERLERWAPEERIKYLALQRVESEQAPLIESIILNLYNSFNGCEVPFSEGAKRVIRQIDQLQTGLDVETNSLIQESLRETLRDYQIMNNSLVRQNSSLVVRLKNASEGFEVVKRAEGEVTVLQTSLLSDIHYMIRTEKPAGLFLKAGAAVKLTIVTAEGPVSGILSLANSPHQNFLEFAVAITSSNFKQAIKNLAIGDSITLENVSGGMDFKSQLPSVLIAGGIGITPFRSWIQEAAEQNFKQPIQLIYANRNQIPFESEFQKYSQLSDNFKVINILSNANESWNGLRGRIDSKLLSQIVAQQPSLAQYYLVGSPEMVMGIQAQLLNLGITKESITIEAFSGYSGTNPNIYDTHSANSSTNKMICFCHSVTEDQILDSIASGAKSIEDIQSQTLASTGCGNCICNVKNILQCKAKK